MRVLEAPCFPNLIPGFLQYGDTPDLVGLIAPRALHLNFGEMDRGSPIEEVREGIKTIAAAYRQAGAEDRFSHYIESGSSHVLSEEMWRRTRECFKRHLIARIRGHTRKNRDVSLLAPLSTWQGREYGLLYAFRTR